MTCVTLIIPLHLVMNHMYVCAQLTLIVCDLVIETSEVGAGIIVGLAKTQ